MLAEVFPLLNNRAVGQAAGAAAALLFDAAAVLGAEALDHIAAESALRRHMAAVVFGRLDNGNRPVAVDVLRFGIVMAGGVRRRFDRAGDQQHGGA